jgi:hypothetical protein
MHTRHCLQLAVTFLALASWTPAGAQGTKADYERSAALRQRFDEKVVRDRIAPRWLADGRLTYRVALPGGKSEAWVVDPKSGKKSPYVADPNAAPETLRPRSPGSLRSGENGEETEIAFENRTQASVRLFWVDGAGARREYGTLAAGAVRPQHTFAGHAWLITDAGGKPLVGFVAEGESGRAVITGEAPPPDRPRNAERSPRREGREGESPDGKWTAFRKEHNLWVRETATGKETALTTDGVAEKFLDGPLRWSPDSRRLVAFRTVPAQERKVHIVESSPKDQLQPKLLSIDYLKPGDRVRVSKPCLFDPVKGAEIPIADALFPNPWSLTDLRWQPDAKRFTFLYNQRGHQTLRVIAVDAETGAAQPIVDEQSKTFIDYAGKFYSRHLDETGELIWMSERDGWCHLYLYDARKGQVKNQITRGEWVVRGVDRVDPQLRQIWFRAGGIYPDQDPYYVHYCRVNFDGTGLVRLTAGDGNHTVEYSPDGKHLLDRYSRVDLPTVTELRRVSDGSLVLELERGDASALLAAGWKAPPRTSMA